MSNGSKLPVRVRTVHICVDRAKEISIQINIAFIEPSLHCKAIRIDCVSEHQIDSCREPLRLPTLHHLQLDRCPQESFHTMQAARHDQTWCRFIRRRACHIDLQLFAIRSGRLNGITLLLQSKCLTRPAEATSRVEVVCWKHSIHTRHCLLIRFQQPSHCG